MEPDLILYSMLLLYQYFFSAIKKFNTFEQTVKSFKSKFFIKDLNEYIYKLIIIFVILLQFCVPVYTIYTIYTKTYNYLSFYLIIALVFFTMLATLLYHYPPIGNKVYAFNGNICAIGGLLLLSYIIYNKIPIDQTN